MPFHIREFGLMMVAIDAIKPDKTIQTILYSLTIWDAVCFVGQCASADEFFLFKYSSTGFAT